MGLSLALAGVLTGTLSAAGGYTVGVDGQTGRLIRVPATRVSRPVAARTVTARPVPEKVVEARLVMPETPKPGYNVMASRSLDETIARVAGQYGIRPSFVHAVIKAESNYDPRAVSSKGALGLMQLMPQTARELGVRNVFDPAENVEGGVRYLRRLLDLYGSRTALSIAAYNAGPGAVDRFGGVPPYPETRQFVQRVNRLYSLYRSKETGLAPLEAPKKVEGPRIYRFTDASGFVRYTTDSQ